MKKLFIILFGLLFENLFSQIQTHPRLLTSQDISTIQSKISITNSSSWAFYEVIKDQYINFDQISKFTSPWDWGHVAFGAFRYLITNENFYANLAKERLTQLKPQ